MPRLIIGTETLTRSNMDPITNLDDVLLHAFRESMSSRTWAHLAYKTALRKVWGVQLWLLRCLYFVVSRQVPFLQRYADFESIYSSS